MRTAASPIQGEVIASIYSPRCLDPHAQVHFLSRTSTCGTPSLALQLRHQHGVVWQPCLGQGLCPELAQGAELRASRCASFRQAQVGQWLQDSHERVDTQLDRLTTRNSQLNYNRTAAQLLDMKHKKLSEMMAALEQEKGAAELSQFEKSRQCGDLQEKDLQLEKELLQMRSTLDRENGRSPGSLGRASPMSQEDLSRQERQEVDAELCKLKESLRDAEASAKKQEEERNQAFQRLQTSTEEQRALLNQIQVMNKSFTLMKQNYSEVQEQLSEANNKISQACLEKAILSTQVLKLEDDIKELKAKQTRPLSDRSHLTQNKAVLEQTALMKEELKALKEVNEKLKSELEMLKQELNTTQSQLQEATAERVINSKQITDLQAECSQLVREKDDVCKMNEGRREELKELKEKCSQLRESLEVLESEKLNLQDRCLCLEAEVLEKEEKLNLQEEEYQKQDAVRVQSTKELKAVAKHWTEKWQKVALTLQSTQEELEELKKNNSRNERESESLLKVELDACKQELELERSRSRALLHRYKGGAVQTQDQDTVTDLSQSSLSWEPLPESTSSQNKPPQASDKARDDGSQANVSITESMTAQLEESRRRADQLRQEKTLAVHKLQSLRQPHPVKDEKPSVEDRKDKPVCPVSLDTEQQRRMVTEQLKNLFKEREGKEAGKVENRPAAAQTGASSLQDRTRTSKVMRAAADRRSWPHGSGLMPVFEEDEESCDWVGEEGGHPAEEAHTETNVRNQDQQMSTMSAEIRGLKAKNENLLQAALRCEQPDQDCPLTAVTLSEKSPTLDVQQKRAPSLYPDGIFLAELVDICSPDEGEDEGEGK
ncbi:uncharacterized protein AB9X84_012435 isoform 2-T2 [Acanthopagrus schlegelii]